VEEIATKFSCLSQTCWLDNLLKLQSAVLRNRLCFPMGCEEQKLSAALSCLGSWGHLVFPDYIGGSAKKYYPSPQTPPHLDTWTIRARTSLVLCMCASIYTYTHTD